MLLYMSVHCTDSNVMLLYMSFIRVCLINVLRGIKGCSLTPDNTLVTLTLNLVVRLCILSVYFVDVTFLSEIWMFATLDICTVISDSKFHKTQLAASNILSSSARC